MVRCMQEDTIDGNRSGGRSGEGDQKSVILTYSDDLGCQICFGCFLSEIVQPLAQNGEGLWECGFSGGGDARVPGQPGSQWAGFWGFLL